jgi:CheY-like chemotaxis protein
MRPIEAADGVAAAAAVEAADRPFGIVLLDSNMPDANGSTVARRLRQQPGCAVAPILLLTSSDHPDDIAAARACGIMMHVVKPVGQIALFDAIRRTIGIRATSDAAPAAPAIIPTRAPRRLRVLVAEDNPVNQKLVQHLLEKRGHAVVIAQHGREALDRLATEHVDLVLMDLQMPEMDGFEAAAVIRARERDGHAHLPIVALTAHAMAGDRQRCLDAGMDGYVSKPIQPVELFDVIDRVVASWPVGREQAILGDVTAAAVNLEAAPRDGDDVIDHIGLTARVQGDMVLLRTCIDVFLADSPHQLVVLRAALDRRDAAAVACAAHGIRGAVGVFSKGVAYSAAGVIERCGKEGDLAKAERTYEELGSGMERLTGALDQLALGQMIVA